VVGRGGRGGDGGITHVAKRRGEVTEAWTGPQVAWAQDRGVRARSEAKDQFKQWLWLVFCGIFLFGLVEWRKANRARHARTCCARLAVGVVVGIKPLQSVRRDAACVSPLRVGAARESGSAAQIVFARVAPCEGLGVYANKATVFLAGFSIGVELRASK